MRALYLSTRLAGTDGVSLENTKVARVLTELGFEAHDCAGEVNGDRAHLIPEMHFEDPVARDLSARAFSGSEPDAALEQALEERAAMLFGRLHEVVAAVRPDLLVLQNVWAIPMQLPLAAALARLVDATGLPTLSHEHDYYWERERFAVTRIPGFLERYFPYHAANVRHLCINSLAQRSLLQRRGLHATLLPNVLDFAAPAPGIDDYNRDFRQAIGLTPDQRLILQPTRVIPRKGIELAIDLLAELADERNVLVIGHHAGDEGMAYLERLQRYALERRVDLRYVADRVDDARGRTAAGEKIYSLWDSYPHADFVTYPSLYEGFGNGLLETIYFRRAALVNRYPVYVADIAPTGIRFVEIDGRVTPDAVAEVARLLADEEARNAMAERNFAIAAEHFSLDAARRILAGELRALGLA